VKDGKITEQQIERLQRILKAKFMLGFSMMHIAIAM
jgi:hypothetical protein